MYTDYREQTDWKKTKIEEMIMNEVEPRTKVDKNGNSYNVRDYIMNAVKNGFYCAECLMPSYNCLCSHGS